MSAPEPRRVTLAGRSFMVDAAREAAFWDKAERGAWEPHTLRLLAAMTGPEAPLLDIGAWIGPTTLFAAAGGADVIAVEADPVALEWLGRNLALNPDLVPRVRIVDRVLHPDGGRVTFGSNRGRGGNSMSSFAHAEMATRWEIEAITPEALAALAPDTTRRLVKVDIEGGEYAIGHAFAPIFAGAEAVLISWHPREALHGRAGADRTRAVSDLRAGLAGVKRASEGFARRALIGAATRAVDDPAARFEPMSGAPMDDWVMTRGAPPTL